MVFKYLDNWDIKRIKDNTADFDMLLMTINDLISTNVDDAYDTGYSEGYNQGCIDTEEY